MNILIAGKTEEICDSIAQLLLELDCDNISIFTSGTSSFPSKPINALSETDVKNSSPNSPNQTNLGLILLLTLPKIRKTV